MLLRVENGDSMKLWSYFPALNLNILSHVAASFLGAFKGVWLRCLVLPHSSGSLWLEARVEEENDIGARTEGYASLVALFKCLTVVSFSAVLPYAMFHPVMPLSLEKGALGSQL